MEPLDERPEIGTLTVDRGTLADEGRDFDRLVSELELEASADLPADLPPLGWRVVETHRGLPSAIAAPMDRDREWWRIGQIVRVGGDSSRPRLSVHPMSFPLRPSRSERARGLVMRWPEVVRSAPDLDLLAVDIVNRGPSRWMPRGDSFVTFAALRSPDGPSPSVGFFAYMGGSCPALPLDPGDYARVKVMIDSDQWAGVRAGLCEVHPFLVDVGLRPAEPLLITLTDEDIRRHQPTPRRPPPPPETML